MPAGKTYVKIASQTLSGSVSSVTFSNLPQNYTDLLIVGSIISSSTSNDTRVQFNGDTGSNYSMTRMYGDSSTVASDRSSNATSMHLGRNSTTITPNIFHIINYSNTTTYKTALGRSGFATGIVLANVGLWRSTAAITSITFLVTGGDTFSSGSTFTIYGIEAAKSPYAEGGDKVYSTGTHWVHEFYNSGTFVPRQNLTADYLVVAGGGGGGSWYYGGGGGAGGLRSTVTATGGGGSLESALSLSGSTAYTVTVGAGGSGGTRSAVGDKGNNGSNSVFSTITSTGGGGGGGTGSGGSSTNGDGQAGGSGGGSGGAGNAGGSGVAFGTAGTGTANQGYAGGRGWDRAGDGAGGGGGGAGAVGGAAALQDGGNGGNGVAVAITGSSITYAGGGGGSGYISTIGTGGTGGGGSSVASDNGNNGTSNLGGGGGGASMDGKRGGNGGSGVVIVRYAI